MTTKVIAARLEGADLDAMMPGSESMPCATCAEMTWVSPQGALTIRAQQAEVICVPCAMQIPEAMAVLRESADAILRGEVPTHWTGNRGAS